MAKGRADLSAFKPTKPDVLLIEQPPARSAKKAPAEAPAASLKLKSFRLPADLIRRLAVLKAESGRSEQELMAEALELLLRKHKGS